MLASRGTVPGHGFDRSADVRLDVGGSLLAALDGGRHLLGEGAELGARGVDCGLARGSGFGVRRRSGAFGFDGLRFACDDSIHCFSFEIRFHVYLLFFSLYSSLARCWAASAPSTSCSMRRLALTRVGPGES